VREEDIFVHPEPKFDQKDFTMKDFKDKIDPGDKIGKEKEGKEEPIFLPEYRCNPSDWKGYLVWVEKVIERYDGDGFNDMPGLRIPVKYWEIINEPDLNASFLDFYNGSPADYAQLLIKTAEVIRKADPEAKVLIAGAAGGNDGFLNFYRQVLADKQTHKAFDIGNVHCISNDDYETFNVAPYQEMLKEFGLNKPIWVTEAESLISTEIDVNASQTLESTQNALGLGAVKIFFSSQKFMKKPEGYLPEKSKSLSDFKVKLNGDNYQEVFSIITSQ